MSLYELTYCSFAANNLKQKDILKILAKSKEYNKKHNITGCLLYHNHEFLQILEGEEDYVLEVFEKIQNDKRHDQIILLKQGKKNNRLFENWNMTYYDLNSEEHVDVNKQLFIDNLINFSRLSLEKSGEVTLFWRLARQLLLT